MACSDKTTSIAQSGLGLPPLRDLGRAGLKCGAGGDRGHG